jgi:hypothetical protein
MSINTLHKGDDNDDDDDDNNSLPTFRDNLSVPSSGVKNPRIMMHVVWLPVEIVKRM